MPGGEGNRGRRFRAEALPYGAERGLDGDGWFDRGGVGEVRERLRAAVLSEMATRTTALSRTLLRFAAGGLAVQPLLDVLWTLGSKEPVKSLELVASIGHTSGRDMLAGAAMAASLALGGHHGAPLVHSP